MTTFTEISIDLISPHPKNIRRHVEADAEMVESIKAHGIITAITVVPAADKKAYQLIGGHRRLDGARKAGLVTVPAMIRDDLVTEADHIGAMAIENVHRVDLTAIEEAAAFEQLALIGFTAAEISQKTGRAQSTVTSRLKLTALHDVAKDGVHGHQITLDQANDLLTLEDRSDLLKKVEKTIGTDNFNYELRSALSTRREDAEIAAALAECKASGLPEVKIKSPHYYGWSEAGPRPPRDGEVADAWAYDYRNRPTLVITKPPKRKKSAAEIAEDARWKKERQAREALQQKEVDARDLRVEHLVALSPGVKISTDLQPIIRLALGARLSTMQKHEVEAIAKTAGADIVRSKDWRDTSVIGQVGDLTAKDLHSLLVAVLSHDAEVLVGRATSGYVDTLGEVDAGLEYFAALDGSGYTIPTIDKKKITAMTKTRDRLTAAAAKKASAA